MAITATARLQTAQLLKPITKIVANLPPALKPLPKPFPPIPSPPFPPKPTPGPCPGPWHKALGIIKDIALAPFKFAAATTNAAIDLTKAVANAAINVAKGVAGAAAKAVAKFFGF